jgi:phage replication-related protein YjqB (UPF0714/DUF867 family)
MTYAVSIHGYVRMTNDINNWVRPTPENAERVIRALGEFGFRVSVISLARLRQNKAAAGRAKDVADLENLPPD